MIRQRPAPSAMRTEISRERPMARASRRFARLAEAIRSTNPTAPHMVAYVRAASEPRKKPVEVFDDGMQVLIGGRVGGGEPLPDDLHFRACVLESDAIGQAAERHPGVSIFAIHDARGLDQRNP